MLLIDFPTELLGNVLSRAGWAPRCACRAFRRVHDVGCDTLNLDWAHSDFLSLVEVTNLLRRLPQLTTLTCHGARDVVHLGPLAVCSRVQTLNLRGFGSLTDLGALTNLSALTALHLETNDQYVDTDIIAGCRSIAVLSLTGLLELNTNPLIRCARLVSLNLSNSTLAATALPLSASCRHLTALQVSKTPAQNGHHELNLVRALGQSPLLQSLKLGPNAALVNMRLVSKCSALQHLSLNHCRGDCDMKVVASCVRLTKLNLSWCGPWVTDLGPLAACTGLRHLNLNACYKLTSIAPLAACAAQLTHLDCHSCHRVADLGPLSACSRLTCLDLRGCHNVSDLQPLSTCTALTRLDLRCCRRVRSIAGLSTCRQLVDLDLTLCPLVSDLRPLAALTLLETLHLDQQPVGSIAPLANCVRLTWATISLPRCVDISALSACVRLTNLNLEGSRRLTDVSALRACTQLQQLKLAGCDMLFAGSSHRQLGPPLTSDLRALAFSASASLTSVADACRAGAGLVDNVAATLASTHVDQASAAGALALPAPPDGAGLSEALHTGAAALWAAQSVAAAVLRDIDGLGQRLEQRLLSTACSRVGDLNLNSCRSIAIAPVAGLEHLTRLNLDDCTSLTDISALPTCRHLRSVSMHCCTRLLDLRPLSACSGLASLDLSKCCQITDVVPLQPLARLASLTLSGLNNLVSLKPLAELVDLSYLMLSGCSEVYTLRPLAACTKLQEISVCGCVCLADLSPLWNAKQLRRVYLDSGNRALLAWASRGPVRLKLQQHPALAMACRDLPTLLMDEGGDAAE